MSIGGVGNNQGLFNLNNIKTLASSNSGSNKSSGGVFDLGNSSSGSTGGPGENDSIASGNLGLGDVKGNDPNVSQALNSVAGDDAIQQQFRNQLALVNLQERVQSQSRTIEILTNILKARHDAALSAARNVK